MLTLLQNKYLIFTLSYYFLKEKMLMYNFIQETRTQIGQVDYLKEKKLPRRLTPVKMLNAKR